MNPEERIAHLEAELARERARADGLQEIVHALTVKRRSSGAERQARYRERHAVTSDVTVTRDVTPTTPSSSSSPFPSSFPPSPAPSSPYPLSFPPSSPPSPIPPASQAAPRVELHLEQQEQPKRARQKRKDVVAPDPRHSRLVAMLTAEGWPFDGGRDAANVTQLLALADQQDATRGELAGQEVLRRARIAWAQFPGFHSARTLTGLRSKWGEFSEPDMGGRGPAPPSDFSRNVPLPERSEFAPPVDDTPF